MSAPDDINLADYWREVASILCGRLARYQADHDPLAYRRMVLAYTASEPAGAGSDGSQPPLTGGSAPEPDSALADSAPQGQVD